MSVKIGEKYYFIQHAYHHFLGEVVEVLGKNSVTVKNVIRVYSCSRGWTEFFRDGCRKDTTYTVWPDGHAIHNFQSSTPWCHLIPGK